MTIKRNSKCLRRIKLEVVCKHESGQIDVDESLDGRKNHLIVWVKRF